MGYLTALLLVPLLMISCGPKVSRGDCFQSTDGGNYTSTIRVIEVRSTISVLIDKIAGEKSEEYIAQYWSDWDGSGKWSEGGRMSKDIIQDLLPITCPIQRGN